VGVPRFVAMTMTYPERVTRYNIAKLRQCVLRGPDKHPGATRIRMRDGSFVKALAYGYVCRVENVPFAFLGGFNPHACVTWSFSFVCFYSLTLHHRSIREVAAKSLRIGDVVERHMEDDDIGEWRCFV
jgi:DNA-directed RNA polymerase beta' subunit